MNNHFTQLNKEDREDYLERISKWALKTTPLKYIPKDELRLAVISRKYEANLNTTLTLGSAAETLSYVLYRMDIELTNEEENNLIGESDSIESLMKAIDVIAKKYNSSSIEIKSKLVDSLVSDMKDNYEEEMENADEDIRRSGYNLKFDVHLHKLDGSYDRTEEDICEITFYEGEDRHENDVLKADVKFKGGLEVEKRYLDGMFMMGDSITMFSDTLVVTNDLKYAKSSCWPYYMNPLSEEIRDFLNPDKESNLSKTPDYKKIIQSRLLIN